jgi:thioredoxin 1
VGFSVVWQALPALADPAPSQGKPAIIDFGRGTCLQCKEMEKVLTIKSEYGDQVEVRLVRVEESNDLVKQYKIMLVPTQIFLDAEGHEVDRHMGAWSKEDVIRKLKALKFIRQEGIPSMQRKKVVFPLVTDNVS